HGGSRTPTARHQTQHTLWREIAMAGVRKLASGTWQGWYMNHAGKRQFFTLSKTAGKRETLQTAQDLDTHHRKIALGTLPPPTRQRTALTRTMEEMISEYL